MHAIEEKLNESPATRIHQYAFQYGVAFPEMLVGTADLGPDAPRECVIGGENLDDLEGAVRRLFGTSIRKPISRDALQALIDVLKPTTEVAKYQLRSHLLDQEREMVRLVENQYQVMDQLRRHRKAVIAGCAGSGKTLLAMEKARRLANEGFDVLLTCYNKRLAGWMRTSLDRDSGAASGRIRVNHYHELADQLCKQAGLPLTFPTAPAEFNEFFQTTMPEAFFAALPKVPVRFDAIVVDEGQDFADTWWITLNELLRDSDDGVFYIFHDEAQRLYQRESSFPFDVLPIELTHNLRNTRRIHDQVVRYHHGDVTPIADGPDGQKPEIVPLKAGDQVEDVLARVVTRLVDEQSIDPRDITVLTPRSQGRSTLPEGLPMGTKPWTLTWTDNASARSIQISTIHSWKGLESPIVIIAETDGLRSHHLGDALCYVALSRAKHHLIVIGELPTPRPTAATALA
ncbi:MAG: AAA family ATPase, partial [Chloroflexota bacterium]|nr:AAA family ATPase [Chloroflexota bacterium]